MLLLMLLLQLLLLLSNMHIVLGMTCLTCLLLLHVRLHGKCIRLLRHVRWLLLCRLLLMRHMLPRRRNACVRLVHALARLARQRRWRRLLRWLRRRLRPLCIHRAIRWLLGWLLR